jgi:hypothetical protein
VPALLELLLSTLTSAEPGGPDPSVGADAPEQ